MKVDVRLSIAESEDLNSLTSNAIYSVALNTIVVRK